MRPRLITIPLSHYCERARWALDHAEIDYDEDQHLQFMAARVAKAAGGTKTVPVLVCEDGTFDNSDKIVRWAATRARVDLYPHTVTRADIEALETALAGRFGEETRRIAYDWFFRSLAYCRPYNACSAPKWEDTMLQVIGPVAAPFIKRYAGQNEAALVEADAIVRKTMDMVADRLADGRRYLFGDIFTAADLTFAALGAPCVGPPRYGVPFPPPEDLPDEKGRNFILEMREHPAGRFILRLYKEIRPAVRGAFPRPSRAASLQRPPYA